MKAVFDTHGLDSRLNARSGEVVTVLRPLASREADLQETGPMYKIKFTDVYETGAFADELSPV